MSLALKASQRAVAAAKRHHATPFELFRFYRKSAVPEGGWTQENFTAQAESRLTADTQNVKRAAVLRVSRQLNHDLKKLMREQVERVVQTVIDSTSRLYGVHVNRGAKVLDVTFNIPVHSSIWEQAMLQEFAHAGLPVISLFSPAVQSVAADTFGKTTILFGGRPTQRQISALNVRTRSIVSKVTDINETTRNRLRARVANGIRDSLTFHELNEDIRNNIPSIATNRVPTIVRTELGRAADAGIKHAMVSSGNVTHFNVVGCQDIEPDIPTLLGFPTCNLMGIPIQHEAYIEFHINHTGCIVAGAFRQSDGSIPRITMRNAEGIGTWEDRGSPVPAIMPPPVMIPPPA